MLDHLHRFRLRAAALQSAAGIPVSDAADPAEVFVSYQVMPSHIDEFREPVIPGNSVVIDIETLDQTPRSVITEIGVVAFVRQNFKPFASIDLRLDLFDQIATRQVSADTIAFHRKNGTLPKLEGGLSRFLAAAKLTEFFALHKPKHVWIQGPCFDRPILEDFFADLGQPLPWRYSLSRDCRTLWDTTFPGVKHPPRPHCAVNDAFATLYCLEEALTALGRRHAC